MAFSYMWQTRERLADHAQAATNDNGPLAKHAAQEPIEAEWLSLAEAELLWDYPNPDQLEGDSCRMGFPDWRRQLVLPLIEACTDSGLVEQVLERSCVDRWSTPFTRVAKDNGILKAGLYNGLRQAAGVNKARDLTVRDLYRDETAKLWRRVAVLLQFV
eukprot:COSAG02_NODE_2235_length_9420_cov_27.032722_3_plen_159_part_00